MRSDHPRWPRSDVPSSDTTSRRPHPLFGGGAFERHFLGVWAASTAWIRIDWEERLGRQIEHEEFEPLAWALARSGAEQSAGQHLKNVQELQRVARTVAGLYADIDVLLTRVTAAETLPLGSFEGRAGFENARRCMAFTMLANVTGQPAMSVPIGQTTRRSARRSGLHGPIRRRGHTPPTRRTARTCIPVDDTTAHPTRYAPDRPDSRARTVTAPPSPRDRPVSG